MHSPVPVGFFGIFFFIISLTFLFLALAPAVALWLFNSGIGCDSGRGVHLTSPGSNPGTYPGTERKRVRGKGRGVLDQDDR